METEGDVDKVTKKSRSNQKLAIGLIIFIILAGPYIVRFGYCQGWWLTASPWPYYWWLCDCGPEFEQSLYPDNIEVIVSACRDPQNATLSSDGRYMIVSLRPKYEHYLLDLVTDQQQVWPHQIKRRFGDTGFWTDRLVLVTQDGNEFELVDVVDGNVIELTRLNVSPQGSVVSAEALEIFREADRVLIQRGGTIALALSADPNQNPDRNYALRNYYKRVEQLKTFLSENDIPYEDQTPCRRASLCTSHKGQFVATDRVIWETVSSENQKVSELETNPSFRLGIHKIGWAHDDSGIYLQFLENHIVRGGYVFPPQYRLRQPIVKLKVPEAYLPLAPTPTP